jgi:hypothetical protein
VRNESVDSRTRRRERWESCPSMKIQWGFLVILSSSEGSGHRIGHFIRSGAQPSVRGQMPRFAQHDKRGVSCFIGSAAKQSLGS